MDSKSFFNASTAENRSYIDDTKDTYDYNSAKGKQQTSNYNMSPGAEELSNRDFNDYFVNYLIIQIKSADVQPFIYFQF